MNPSEMTDEVLVDTFACSAVRIDETDLDLIDSCRRLSTEFSRLRFELLSRMGGKKIDNEILLRQLKDNAVEANAEKSAELLSKHDSFKKAVIDRICQKREGVCQGALPSSVG